MNVKNREVKERDRRMRISADMRCRVKRVERQRSKEDMGRETATNSVRAEAKETRMVSKQLQGKASNKIKVSQL